MSNLPEANSPKTDKESPRISQAWPKFLKQKTIAASDGTAPISLSFSSNLAPSIFVEPFSALEYNFVTANAIPPTRTTAVTISMVSVFLFIREYYCATNKYTMFPTCLAGAVAEAENLESLAARMAKSLRHLSPEETSSWIFALRTFPEGSTVMITVT